MPVSGHFQALRTGGPRPTYVRFKTAWLDHVRRLGLAAGRIQAWLRSPVTLWPCRTRRSAGAPRHGGRDDLLMELRRLAGVFLGVCSATLLGVSLASAQAFDFHTFWVAGGRFLRGDDPYPALAQLHAFSPVSQQSFIYPAPVAAFFAPLSLLPYALAKPLFVAALAVAVAVSLLVLGVRDWRCYAAAFASPAVLSGISVGTISPLLLLGLALVWRSRERPWRCGITVALVVVAKLFLWPLLLWLVFSGRRRSAAVAGASAAALCVAGWMRLGFQGVDTYPGLLHRMSVLEGPHGDGVLWALGGLHLYELVIPVAAVVVAVSARRLSVERSFAIAIAVALVSTPILWVHYLAVLPVVAAIAAPELSGIWLFPLLLWLPLFSHSHRFSVLAIAAVVLGCTLTLGRGRRAPKALPAPAAVYQL
jgi:hypothetical protein